MATEKQNSGCFVCVSSIERSRRYCHKAISRSSMAVYFDPLTGARLRSQCLFSNGVDTRTSLFSRQHLAENTKGKCLWSVGLLVAGACFCTSCCGSFCTFHAMLIPGATMNIAWTSFMVLNILNHKSNLYCDALIWPIALCYNILGILLVSIPAMPHIVVILVAF